MLGEFFWLLQWRAISIIWRIAVLVITNAFLANTKQRQQPYQGFTGFIDNGKIGKSIPNNIIYVVNCSYLRMPRQHIAAYATHGWTSTFQRAVTFSALFLPFSSADHQFWRLIHQWPSVMESSVKMPEAKSYVSSQFIGMKLSSTHRPHARNQILNSARSHDTDVLFTEQISWAESICCRYICCSRSAMIEQPVMCTFDSFSGSDRDFATLIARPNLSRETAVGIFYQLLQSAGRKMSSNQWFHGTVFSFHYLLFVWWLFIIGKWLFSYRILHQYHWQ